MRGMHQPKMLVGKVTGSTLGVLLCACTPDEAGLLGQSSLRALTKRPVHAQDETRPLYVQLALSLSINVALQIQDKACTGTLLAHANDILH